VIATKHARGVRFVQVFATPRTCKPMSCALLKACPALIQLVASATHRGLGSVAHKPDGRPRRMRTVPAGVTDRLQRESLHTKKSKNAQVSLIPDQWRTRSLHDENRLTAQSDSTPSSSRRGLAIAHNNWKGTTGVHSAIVSQFEPIQQFRSYCANRRNWNWKRKGICTYSIP